MPTIREIADHADVSTGTVSRVLNSHPNVSPASREKVLQAVNELRDSSAAGSRRGTTSIAFVYRGQSSINSRFDSLLLHGIAEELVQTDHDLMIVNAMRLRMEGESLGQMLLRRGVAGALIRTTSLTNTMCDELGQEGFPAVLVADRTDNEQIGTAYYDTEQAVSRAMDHLVQLGHRRSNSDPAALRISRHGRTSTPPRSSPYGACSTRPEKTSNDEDAMAISPRASETAP